MSEVYDKITEYVFHGGLYNPELMQHEKVRNLLIESRAEIAKLHGDAEVSRLRLEAAHAENGRLNEAIRRLADQDATLSQLPKTPRTSK